jgi:hypothetical protein
MAKKKYQAVELLWSPSQKKYLHPGEVIELEDDIAKVLLAKKAIKPAVYRRKAKAKKK